MAPTAKVLIVDDERGVREAIRMLLKEKYHVATAASGTEGIASVSTFLPDVVLLDLRIPDIPGIEILRHIKSHDPLIEVILVTAYATMETARKAVRLGAFDYITKPFNPTELEAIVERAYQKRADELVRLAMLESYQQNYQSLRAEVDEAKNQIITHAHETIYALLTSLELRDKYSGQHSMAVLQLVDQFCRMTGTNHEDRLRLKRAALVHDLGKIGISEDILNKPEPLLPSERQAMQQHPILSVEIISNVQVLADLVPIVRSHHERWDGGGYPNHLRGEEIPREALILALCDTIHAMSSKRCYRGSLPTDHIIRELRDQRGKQFNPDDVDAIIDTDIITDVFLYEKMDELTLTSQNVRLVLNESMESQV